LVSTLSIGPPPAYSIPFGGVFRFGLAVFPPVFTVIVSHWAGEASTRPFFFFPSQADSLLFFPPPCFLKVSRIRALLLLGSCLIAPPARVLLFFPFPCCKALASPSQVFGFLEGCVIVGFPTPFPPLKCPADTFRPPFLLSGEGTWSGAFFSLCRQPKSRGLFCFLPGLASFYYCRVVPPSQVFIPLKVFFLVAGHHGAFLSEVFVSFPHFACLRAFSEKTYGQEVVFSLLGWDALLVLCVFL